MGVNLVCGELLDETFGLIQGQKLGYTDTHECGLFLENFFYSDVRLRPHATSNRMRYEPGL
jgi:hypothetical protein